MVLCLSGIKNSFPPKVSNIATKMCNSTTANANAGVDPASRPLSWRDVITKVTSKIITDIDIIEDIWTLFNFGK